MKLVIVLRTFLDTCGRMVGKLHEYFREVPLFGSMVFCLLTVVLLLPPFGGAGTDAIKYAMLLLSLGLAGFTLRGDMKGSVLPWLNRWIVVFIIWITIVTVFARDPLAAFLGSTPRYNSSWLFFVSFAGVLWVCVLWGKEFRTVLERLLLILSMCVSVFGILQSFGIGFYGGITSTLSAVPDRVPSLLGNPNFSSWFVAVVLPLGIGYVLRARSVWKKLAWGISAFLSVWSLAVFSSRGSLLAAIVGYMVFIVCMMGARRWRVVLGLVGVAIAVAVVFGGFYTLYRPVSGGGVVTVFDSSANDRFVAWAMAGEMWNKHKWLGVGPGNFDQYYWELLPTTRMGGDQYFDDAHNVLFSVLAEMGMPGFVLVTFLFGAAAVFVVRNMFSKSSSSETMSWPTAAAALAAWLVAAMFNPPVIPVWLLLAVLLAILFLEDRAHMITLHFKWPSRVVGGLVGVVVILLSIGIIVGEYGMVYTIALEPYHSYPDVAARQARVTHFASEIAPYYMEARYGDIFTRIRKGAPASVIRQDIQSAFSLHPDSARSALVAAQLCADLWYRDRQSEDLDRGDAYLQRALLRSSGFPVVESWAAIYYWRTDRMAQSEKYARYASYKQPRYLDNWLLLAKIYREKRNIVAMQFALDKAQELVPGNIDLAKMRKQLRDAHDVRAVELRPGEVSTITRLH